MDERDEGETDDDGNVIDGYMDKENIDMNFDDDEDE